MLNSICNVHPEQYSQFLYFFIYFNNIVNLDAKNRLALVNSTIWLRELPLWTVDAVSDIIPFGQKPELHT